MLLYLVLMLGYGGGGSETSLVVPVNNFGRSKYFLFLICAEG